MVKAPYSFATFTPCNTFAEFPLAEMAITTSPGSIKLRNCSAKTLVYSVSLDYAVIRGTLSVSDIARMRGWPGTMAPLLRSVAIWEAVAALPPFPNRKICLPCFEALNRIRIISQIISQYTLLSILDTLSR